MALLMVVFGSLILISLPAEKPFPLRSQSQIASRFLLTDLCLSTESRHTRHISQPELMAAFQDIPGFYDHFPSSSFFRLPDNGKNLFVTSPAGEQ